MILHERWFTDEARLPVQFDQWNTSESPVPDFFGWRELVGHLPIYGILALLLLWGDERPGERGALVKALSGDAR